MTGRDETVAQIFARLAEGDRSAVAHLLPHVYDELHELAVAMFRRQPPDHTLQPTALVHGAYLPIAGP